MNDQERRVAEWLERRFDECLEEGWDAGIIGDSCPETPALDEERYWAGEVAALMELLRG